MPISKFKCRDCGKEFAKILVSLGDAPKSCPICGAASPEDLGAAFHADPRQMERGSCVSCDSCGDEVGSGIRAPT